MYFSSSVNGFPHPSPVIDRRKLYIHEPLCSSGAIIPAMSGVQWCDIWIDPMTAIHVDQTASWTRLSLRSVTLVISEVLISLHQLSKTDLFFCFLTKAEEMLAIGDALQLFPSKDLSVCIRGQLIRTSMLEEALRNKPVKIILRKALFVDDPYALWALVTRFKSLSLVWTKSATDAVFTRGNVVVFRELSSLIVQRNHCCSVHFQRDLVVLQKAYPCLDRLHWIITDNHGRIHVVNEVGRELSRLWCRAMISVE